jgi:hypothetical protein
MATNNQNTVSAPDFSKMTLAQMLEFQKQIQQMQSDAVAALENAKKENEAKAEKLIALFISTVGKQIPTVTNSETLCSFVRNLPFAEVKEDELKSARGLEIFRLRSIAEMIESASNLSPLVRSETTLLRFINSKGAMNSAKPELPYSGRKAGEKLTAKDKLDLLTYWQANPNAKVSEVATKFNTSEATAKSYRPATV